MKCKMMLIGLAASLMFGCQAFAQDIASCTESTPCNTCDTCVTCNSRPCELFSGLKNLIACRPCVGCAPVCAPCAVPEISCAPCAVPEISPCTPVCEIPECQGPVFPYLKPALVNAVHRPVNGVCKMVHGVFGKLADVTAPTCNCGLFSDCTCGISNCGPCLTCGTIGPCSCGTFDTCGSCTIENYTPSACGPATDSIPESPEVK